MRGQLTYLPYQIFPQATTQVLISGRGVYRGIQTTSIGSADSVTTVYDSRSGANGRILDRLLGDVQAEGMPLMIDVDNGVTVITTGTTPQGVMIVAAQGSRLEEG